ncbi:hypothetical protein D9615_004829 [Tricholomella constricta]|uniref:Autophagy-related protein 27 n=1 Tax=Tricholomella constricta TaxID=117010 RepID=A0A8H5HHI9_9AGAR|nr:hypothetical protein D9615_004829 [Tricholomella constricta]
MLTTLSIWLAWASWLSRVHFVAAVDSGGSDNGLPKCTFAIKQLEFDLCPLFQAHSAAFDITIDEETPPTHTKHVYAVSFGGPLKRDGTLPAELQCPEGTRICLTVVNTRPNHPSEPPRILQVIPVVGADLSPKAVLGKKVNAEDHHAPLQVTLHGGSYIHQSQKATFLFHCDHDAEEPMKPSFTWKFNGTHAFSWKTKHACHKPLATPQPDPEPDQGPPQGPPKDPESDPSNDIDESPSRSISIFTFLWIAIVTLFVARLIYFLYPRRNKYRRLPSALSIAVTEPVRSLFSTGKNHNDNDISRMYHAAYFELDDDEGEEVPLTPSPSGTFTRGARYYGSF